MVSCHYQQLQILTYMITIFSWVDFMPDSDHFCGGAAKILKGSCEKVRFGAFSLLWKSPRIVLHVAPPRAAVPHFHDFGCSFGTWTARSQVVLGNENLCPSCALGSATGGGNTPPHYPPELLAPLVKMKTKFSATMLHIIVILLAREV